MSHEKELARLPHARDQKVFDRAAYLLAQLAVIFGDDELFFEKYLPAIRKPVLKMLELRPDDATFDLEDQTLRRATERAGGDTTIGLMDSEIEIISLSVGFITAAQYFSDKGEETAGWSYLVSASFWLGVVMGRHSALKKKSWDASLAAILGHRHNHAAQQKAVKFYQENRKNFRSRSAAAKHIAEKLVAREFRTVYRWLTDTDKGTKGR